MSDDWSHLSTLQIEGEIPSQYYPDKAYEYRVKTVREAWKEEGEWRIADEFEANLEADRWILEQAKELNLGKVLKAHVFCIRETPKTPDEDTMNVVVLLVED